MTENMQEITMQIINLFSLLANTDNTPPAPLPDPENKPIEMLTVKECTEFAKGISDHTIRQLVAQGKIPYIRAGEGKRGKILIAKPALIEYLYASQ